MRTKIETWIQEFLASTDERFEWLRKCVRASSFLPLYIGWNATLGITSDERIVRLRNEDDPCEPQPVAEPFSQRLAIAQGAKKYPSLITLLERPVDAVDCPSCGGVGEIAGAPQIVCECGGCGWLIPGEKRLDSDG